MSHRHRSIRRRCLPPLGAAPPGRFVPLRGDLDRERPRRFERDEGSRASRLQQEAAPESERET
jgi:hypothetical protein